jgi:hypothetical protein
VAPSETETGRSDDPRWTLARRVAASATFTRAWRAREMLLFLCERVLREPDRPPREHEIAETLFGRGENFDSSVDPLVRVQASTLRTKLRLYFSSEGAAEPLVIEIPKGTYAPIFRTRGPQDDDAEAAPPAVTSPPARAPRAAWWVAAAAVLAALALYARSRPAHPTPESGPALRALWAPFVGPGRASCLVLGDGSLSVYQQVTRHWFSAAQYQRGRQDDTVPPGLPEAEVAQARRLLDHSFTDVGDALLAYQVGALTARLGGTSEVVYARDIATDRFKSGSVVLVGSRRANPWVELFDDRLTYRAHLDKDTQLALFDNATPRAGEPAVLRAAPDQGYCRVALLDRKDTDGRVLMVTGTDLVATRAGSHFVVDEGALEDLAQALGISRGAPFPPFEIVLRVPLVLGTPASFERVVLRSEAPPARREPAGR